MSKLVPVVSKPNIIPFVDHMILTIYVVVLTMNTMKYNINTSVCNLHFILPTCTSVSCPLGTAVYSASNGNEYRKH
jgi:hypothetical protein